jgi:hypothetical protein
MLSDSAREKLLRSIEFSRERLNGYLDRKELTSEEVVSLSQKLDELINLYYQSSAQAGVKVKTKAKTKTKSKPKPKVKVKVKVEREAAQPNTEPTQKHVPIPRRDLRQMHYEAPQPLTVRVGEREYILIKLFEDERKGVVRI